MTVVPRTPLLLGVAGLLPFVWGAAGAVWPGFAAMGAGVVGPALVGAPVLARYGVVILAFMSGVIWGFAAHADDRRAPMAYVLSVIPALWAFFLVPGPGPSSLIVLIAGFVGLLGIDWLFWRHGLAPAWWMQLRMLLTAVVVACLLAGLSA